MTPFGMHNRFTAVSGERDALAAQLLRAAELVTQATDCLLYIVNASTDNDDDVWVTELWTDEDAHRASFSIEGVAPLIAETRRLIAGSRQIRLRPLGGKGV